MFSGFLLFSGWWWRRRYQVGKLNSLNVSYDQQATLQFIILTGVLYTGHRGLRGKSPFFFILLIILLLLVIIQYKTLQ